MIFRVILNVSDRHYRFRLLIVQYSEFGFNGYGDGQSHGIYVGNIDEFIFQFNYVHHTKSGHHVKSRARVNRIEYNYLTDHNNGNASYAIDLPDGGKALVVGNILHQSKFTENYALIHYGMPRSKAGQPFYVVNNTALSSRFNGIFVLNHSPAIGVIINNLLVGNLQIASGRHREAYNFAASNTCFSPRPSFPYILAPDCGAIDFGALLNELQTADFRPRFEYVHPLSRKARRIVGKVDIGAYEYEN